MSESQQDAYARQVLFGLGGAEFQVQYRDRADIRAAVTWLMSETDGHPHHFAVVGEGTTLACSAMALECLDKVGLLGTPGNAR
jgi:hypothetical protein